MYYLKNEKESVVKGFEKAGILEAVESAQTFRRGKFSSLSPRRFLA